MESITLITISSVIALFSVVLTFIGLYQSHRSLKKATMALERATEEQLITLKKEEIEKMLAAIEEGGFVNITMPDLSSESITKAAVTPTKPYKYTGIQFERGILKEV